MADGLRARGRGRLRRAAVGTACGLAALGTAVAGLGTPPAGAVAPPPVVTAAIVGVPDTLNTVVDVDLTPSETGYWVTTSTGAVLAYGTAPHPGDRPALGPGELVVALSPTPSGAGYWLFTTRGRAFVYGDATFAGDLSLILAPDGTPVSDHLNGPVVDAIATPSGAGYWMVASDGGIFAFGDARFLGSMGDTPLNAPVVGLAPTPSNQGYWLVATDGGIFAFGDAGFFGSLGSIRLNAPVSGMIPQGDGYMMMAVDGGIFAFGDSRFHGSLGDRTIHRAIAAVAVRADRSGYLMVDEVGRQYPFGSVVPRAHTAGTFLDTSNRAEVLATYQRDVVAHARPATGWTGSVAGCRAGTVAPSTVDDTLDVLGYFRAMVGLGPVVVDEGWSAKAAEAALMMAAERALSHFPDPSWACYSDAGAEAASRSNLYLGYTGGRAVVGYIEDPGGNNIAVGHRRWLLSPTLTRIGIGNTNASNAIWVVDVDEAPGSGPVDHVAWPTAGYVPRELVFPRWSFEPHVDSFDVDLRPATVTVSVGGQPVPVVVHDPATNGGAAIVFEPRLTLPAGRDTTVTVTIDGFVIDGVRKTATYDVIVVG